MRTAIALLLLATLGCDSTGITGSPDATSDTPSVTAYIAAWDQGECMDDLCTPEVPEDLVVRWAGETSPDCVHVTHRCATFNCCTTLEPEISNTVWIVRLAEHETGPECDCTCRFTPWYTICGLTPGTWDIRLDFSGLSYRVSVI